MRVWPLLFGFAWGMGLTVLDRLFPAGPAVMHSALACYCAVGAVIVWHRTGLHWFALSGVVAALTSAFAVVHPTVDDRTIIDWLINVSGLVAMFLLVLVQSRVDPAAWRELRSSMTSGDVRFRDALLLRPILDLRRQRQTRG